MECRDLLLAPKVSSTAMCTLAYDTSACQQDAEQLPDSNDFAQPSSSDLQVTALHGCSAARPFRSPICPNRFIHSSSPMLGAVLKTLPPRPHPPSLVPSPGHMWLLKVWQAHNLL